MYFFLPPTPDMVAMLLATKRGFDRVYSHHFERVMNAGAKQILQSSVKRYVSAMGGAYDRV